MTYLIKPLMLDNSPDQLNRALFLRTKIQLFHVICRARHKRESSYV